MSINPSQCQGCARLHRADRPASSTEPGRAVRTCPAFPEGIPPIMGLGGDHRHSLPGDRGIRFILGPTAAQAEAFQTWRTTFEVPVAG